MPLWAEWQLPPGTTAIQGTLRAKLGVLQAHAANHHEVSAIVRLPVGDEKPVAVDAVELIVWAPHVGVVRASIPVAATPAAPKEATR